MSTTTTRLTITVPKALAKQAQEAVKKGRAKNVSALLTEALDYYLSKGDFDRILKELNEQYGAPNKKAKQWAARVLREAAALQQQP